MVFRLNAAICGAVTTFAFSSVAMAQSEIDALRSDELVIAASGAAIIGADPCTIRTGPDGGRAA